MTLPLQCQLVQAVHLRQFGKKKCRTNLLHPGILVMVSTHKRVELVSRNKSISRIPKVCPTFHTFQGLRPDFSDGLFGRTKASRNV